MDHALTRASPIPLYRQVEALMVRRIEEGQLAPGARTSEQELTAEFGVSRITIRQALDELQRQGRVVRVPGKGTFVAQRPKLEPQSALTSFSENMEALGRRPGYRTLTVSVVPASEEIAEQLAVASGEPVLRIDRLLLADETPMALMRAHLPGWIWNATPELFDRERLDRVSLYRTLESDLGLQLWKARETVEAMVANDDGDLLGLGRDDLLLVVHRHSYDRDARPVEYTQLRYRADLYRYQVELFRNGARASSRRPPDPQEQRSTDHGYSRFRGAAGEADRPRWK